MKCPGGGCHQSSTFLLQVCINSVAGHRLRVSLCVQSAADLGSVAAPSSRLIVQLNSALMLSQINQLLGNLPQCQHPTWPYFKKIRGQREIFRAGIRRRWWERGEAPVDMQSSGERAWTRRHLGRAVVWQRTWCKGKCRRVRGTENRGMAVTGSQKKHWNEGYCSDYTGHPCERQKTMKRDWKRLKKPLESLCCTSSRRHELLTLGP